MPASSRTGRWSGLAPLATACSLLAGVLALRYLFSANENGTWFLGHAFGSACWVRARFGIPCPNCGMTRSLILAVHGDVARSWRVAPGGVATLLAALVTSLLLAAMGLMALSPRPSTVSPVWLKLQSALRVTIVATAVLCASIWLAGWGFMVVDSLRAR